MKKINSLIITLVFIVSACACTKQQATSELTTSTAMHYLATSTTISELATSTAMPELDPYVVNRARMFAAALATNDIDLVTKMVEFPLNVIYQNGSTQITSRSDFMNTYNTVFTSGFITTYGLADLGNDVVITSNGGVSLTEGDYAIFVNGSGMVTAIQNLTVTGIPMNSTPALTETVGATVDECNKEVLTEDEKVTCAQQEYVALKITLQSILTELQPVVEENQKYLKDFMIDYDQIGDTQKVQSEWEIMTKDQCNWEANFSDEESTSHFWNLQCLVRSYKQRIDDLRLTLCPSHGMTGECESSWYYKQGNASLYDSILPDNSSPTINQLPILSSTDKVQFYVFNRAKLFITAIATDDKETANKMIKYPLEINFSGGSIRIENQQQLMKYYDAIFDQGFIDHFLKTHIEEDSPGGFNGELEIYSKNYNISLDFSGMIVSVTNSYADLENTDPTPTFAPTRTPNPNDCHDTAMTTYDMNMCYGSDVKKGEKTLTNLLNNLRSSMSADDYQKLIQTEKEWESYSSDYCKWYDGFFLTGTIRGVMGSSCAIHQYNQRINNLRLYLCTDHGLSGECDASLRYKQDE
jgi:uncharacterized protein YecT (DUF1311 family)